MLPREARLTRPADFSHVRAQGRSWANRSLVLLAAPNGLPLSRFGISVSRRVGGAVVRNRVKRLIRESLRRQRDLITPGWDVVLIARQGVVGQEMAAVEEATSELLGRARLYRAGGQGAE